jgi:methanogenic corrinoid protein MtbC1
LHGGPGSPRTRCGSGSSATRSSGRCERAAASAATPSATWRGWNGSATGSRTGTGSARPRLCSARRRNRPGAQRAESRSQILEAVERGDGRELGQLLEQAFALHGVEDALTAVVAPLLDELGEAWEEGRVGVAEEHLASEAIRARLVQLLADSRAPVRGIAVLACAPGERHDLGLLMLAILLRADGWHVAYLGADTPLEDAISLAQRLGARVLCLSLAMAKRARGVEDELRARPALSTPVAVGGRGADAMLAKRIGATHVDGDLCRSVRSLRRFSL